jgi:hypothetical protein
MPFISKARLAALADAEARLDALTTEFNDIARLANIEQSGRSVRFLFVRNGQTYRIETYITMDATPEAWRRELLG